MNWMNWIGRLRLEYALLIGCTVWHLLNAVSVHYSRCFIEVSYGVVRNIAFNSVLFLAVCFRKPDILTRTLFPGFQLR